MSRIPDNIIKAVSTGVKATQSLYFIGKKLISAHMIRVSLKKGVTNASEYSTIDQYFELVISALAAVESG